jgi:uncharacterized membrane protein
MTRRHIDPTSFIQAAAAWAAINAFAVIVSGPNLYSRPGFLVMRETHIPQWGLGGAFVMDACALTASILMTSLPFRATVALMSGIFWVLYGLASLYSYHHLGLISTSGLWSVACGLGCVVSVSRWIYVEDHR